MPSPFQYPFPVWLLLSSSLSLWYRGLTHNSPCPHSSWSLLTPAVHRDPAPFFPAGIAVTTFPPAPVSQPQIPTLTMQHQSGSPGAPQAFGTHLVEDQNLREAQPGQLCALWIPSWNLLLNKRSECFKCFLITRSYFSGTSCGVFCWCFCCCLGLGFCLVGWFRLVFWGGLQGDCLFGWLVCLVRFGWLFFSLKKYTSNFSDSAKHQVVFHIIWLSKAVNSTNVRTIINIILHYIVMSNQ